MRTSIHFLTVLIAFLCSTTALAAVDPYEALQVTPAEGVVTSLQHFTITFDGLPVTVDEQAVPTLAKGGGATYEGSMRLDADGTTVLVDFDVCLTASGRYYLNLPENSITVNGQKLLPLTLNFEIEGDMDSFYEQITIDPAEGEVESLERFTISFPQYVGEINYGSRALLTNNTTGSVYYADMYDVGFNVLVYFSQEITEAGEYTLTIPTGAVIFYFMDETVQELNFHYTIVNSGPSIYDQITIDPAEGKVQSLQYFTINFPMEVDRLADDVMATLTNTTTGTVTDAAMSSLDNKVYVNTPQPITEDGRYTLTIPVGAVIIDALGEMVQELNFHYTIAEGEMPDFTINPPEGEVYRLQNFTIAYGTDVIVDENAVPVLTHDETGTSYGCNLIEIGGNAFVYMEYPTSVLGDYTLQVPANCIEIAATGETNPAMTFHYTIVEKDIYIPTVIENQPEGELRVYHRTGGVVREVDKPNPAEDEYPYEIVYEQQDGLINLVFAPDNKVYIEHPVSWSFYYGWVEGTLSPDGKTITVPMGQYVAYTKSFEMAVQVAMFTYDQERGSYFYDESIQEMTYTINDDGSITQNGTDQYTILGTMNRAFGDQFQYLDYEWLQSGDYGSVFILADEQPLTPPDDLVTEDFYLTTANFDGSEWEPYTATVAMGFDGDDVWLRGISKYLPAAWIQGTRNNDGTITFPDSQFLGAYEIFLYFKCADVNPLTGNTTIKDMVLTPVDENTWITYDYVFITEDKNALSYVNFYQGVTISKNPDATVQAPDDLETEPYVFSYTTGDGATDQDVELGYDGDDVYIRGLWEYLPDAWIKGQMVDGRLVIDLPQYLGDYEEEYELSYPIYLVGFNAQTGVIERQVTLDYNPSIHIFSNPSYPLGLGINKTGYLNILDFNEVELWPLTSYFIPGDVNNDGKVNISDATLLISYLLAGSVSGAFNMNAADFNNDGHVNITDATELITMLLNGD